MSTNIATTTEFNQLLQERVGHLLPSLQATNTRILAIGSWALPILMTVGIILVTTYLSARCDLGLNPVTTKGIYGCVCVLTIIGTVVPTILQLIKQHKSKEELQACAQIEACQNMLRYAEDNQGNIQMNNLKLPKAMIEAHRDAQKAAAQPLQERRCKEYSIHMAYFMDHLKPITLLLLSIVGTIIAAQYLPQSNLNTHLIKGIPPILGITGILVSILEFSKATFRFCNYEREDKDADRARYPHLSPEAGLEKRKEMVVDGKEMFNAWTSSLALFMATAFVATCAGSLLPTFLAKTLTPAIIILGAVGIFHNAMHFNRKYEKRHHLSLTNADCVNIPFVIWILAIVGTLFAAEYLPKTGMNEHLAKGLTATYCITGVALGIVHLSKSLIRSDWKNTTTDGESTSGYPYYKTHKLTDLGLTSEQIQRYRELRTKQNEEAAIESWVTPLAIIMVTTLAAILTAIKPQDTLVAELLTAGVITTGVVATIGQIVHFCCHKGFKSIEATKAEALIPAWEAPPTVGR